MSSTIYYHPDVITYDTTYVYPQIGCGYGPGTIYDPQTESSGTWHMGVGGVNSTPTDIIFSWSRPVNTFVGGGVKGFAKSATLHFQYDWGDEFVYHWGDMGSQDPPDPAPGVEISVIWPNFSLFTSEGLYSNSLLLRGNTYTDWTIFATHALVGGIMDISIPIDLTLDNYLPTVRLRIYNYLNIGPTGYCELKISAVYMQIDWEASHGFTAAFKTHADWVTAGVGLPILSAGVTPAAFNPSTGAYNAPTTGNSVAFKSWGSASDANSRLVFIPMSEHH